MDHAILKDVLQAEERPATAVILPTSAQTVVVPTVLRRETRWTGEVPDAFRVVPNKPALTFGNQPHYAEFILLRLLAQGGWSGVWVKNWGGREFWSDINAPVGLPPAQAKLFASIEQLTGNRRGGCWDIFAWQNNDVLFIESKQRSNDRISPSQANWLERALEYGVPQSSFHVAEYVVS